VDHCTIQNNGSFGIFIESASATVTNSMISFNRAGIELHLGGSARIGIITGGSQYAGNTISNNYGSGILIVAESSAIIGGNTINGNGMALNMSNGVCGIQLFNSTAFLIGGNTITNNTGVGVLATNSSVRMGEPPYGLPTHNTITGNGTGLSTIPNGGVQGDLGTTFNIFDADISNNTGSGVIVGRCSNVSFIGLQTTVTGNSEFGLQCKDTNFCSRYGGNTSGITGNTLGDVSTNCTGF
jgi:parallel beta-helix repeat protein